MHIRRQLRNAIVEALQAIDDVRVLTTHRLSVATALAAQGHQAVMVYPIADLEPQRINNAIQGARPTMRGFAFGVALIVGDEDADDGALDDLSVEVERALLADDGPIRRIATRDVSLAGAEVSMIDGEHAAVALPYVIELVVPMIEGVPDQGF
jgi:hypothetical protein